MNASATPTNRRPSFASRAARWSATHRRKAILGWLAFVVIAFIAGNVVKKSEIHGADAYTAEAGRAEQTLEEAGLRPGWS